MVYLSHASSGLVSDCSFRNIYAHIQPSTYELPTCLNMGDSQVKYRNGHNKILGSWAERGTIPLTLPVLLALARLLAPTKRASGKRHAAPKPLGVLVTDRAE